MNSIDRDQRAWRPFPTSFMPILRAAVKTAAEHRSHSVEHRSQSKYETLLPTPVEQLPNVPSDTEVTPLRCEAPRR